MTKAQLISLIGKETGIEKAVVSAVIHSYMELVKKTLENNGSVIMRGFGTFMLKERAEKKARNIKKDTIIIVPAHKIPYFKPAKTFLAEIKEKTK